MSLGENTNQNDEWLYSDDDQCSRLSVVSNGSRSNVHDLYMLADNFVHHGYHISAAARSLFRQSTPTLRFRLFL